MDYKNTTIYKIENIEGDKKLIYVGHTTNFQKRYMQHKTNINRNKTMKLYRIIQENGGWNNFKIEAVECFECDNKKDACLRERKWIEDLNANLNSVKPYLYEDELNDYMIKWRNDNREKINSRHKCECGGRFVWNHKSHHLKSLKHQKYLESQK